MKPLNQKAYGSIGHLPGSRLGPADRTVSGGQARIAILRTRDQHDLVIVQEKLDGANVAVAKLNGVIVPLGRAGHLAISSPWEHHRLFAQWALARSALFEQLLEEGERVCGEWLAQAHGTIYDLEGREPFVAFDLMTGMVRVPFEQFAARVPPYLAIPSYMMRRGAISIEEALTFLGERGHYGAKEPIEGAVWRVERKGKVDFLAKFVHQWKVDGKYMQKGVPEVWNWRPAPLGRN